MLILTRRRGQRIMIGDTVSVKVLRAHDDHVTIGIAAPSGIPVHRQEVYDRLRATEVSGNQPSHAPVAAGHGPGDTADR